MLNAIRSNKLLSSNTWRHLTNFWTLVLYVVIIADFIKRNGLIDFLGPVSAIYIAILAVYTAQKEFERWHDYNIGIHPGEMYVLLWTVLVVTLLVLEVVYHNVYKLPSEVFTTYIVVVGILAITKRSKKKYLKKGKV
jgi:hypothetical protein